MMKKIIVFVFLVMAVMIVAGCQSGETLAGQATKSQMAECKANKNCNALFGACAKEKQCAQQSVACKNACKTEFGSGKAVTNCGNTKCTPAYLTCLDGCYDAAIAAWKGGQTSPVSSDGSKGSNFGDINLDGKVNTQDLQCYVLFAQSSAATCKSALLSNSTLDLNCDGKIDATDQKAVAKLMVGDSSAVDGNKNGVLDCKEPKCVDSDNSGTVPFTLAFNQSAYVAGKVMNGTMMQSVDTCYSPSFVFEGYCGAPSSEFADCSKTNAVCRYDCSKDGAVCKDGACVKEKPKVCPSPDTICSQKPEGWFAFTSGYDSNCKFSGWKSFTTGNTSCGATADSCVAGKGCVVVAPVQLATCTDSDATKSQSWKSTDTLVAGWYDEVHTFGSVVVTNSTYPSGLEFKDYCSSETGVLERICMVDNSTTEKYFDCASKGTTCQNGACVNLTASGSGSGGSGGY